VLSANDKKQLPQADIYLQKFGRIESITCLNAEDKAPESAIALVGEMRILIPMAGLIDKEAEVARLNKEILKLEKDLPRIEGKLNNPKFVDKAPAAVIDKEKEKLASIQSSLINFNEQLVKIKAL
jgi:valyl-tRNA synthetase